MSQTARKQTARKTTGRHVEISAALARLAASKPKTAKSGRGRHIRGGAPVGASGSRAKSSSAVLARQNVPLVTPTAASSLGTPAPSHVSSGTQTSSVIGVLRDVWIPHLPRPNVRRQTHDLDEFVSVFLSFATWLKTQKCVHEETLLHTVERDGGHLLRLAKATVTFDDALRGNVSPVLDGAGGSLSEHARVLHDFAQLLRNRVSEDTLNEELKVAVLRDGEALLYLARCCLEFDQAVRGSGSAQS